MFSAINKTVTLNVASLVTEEEEASVAIFAVEDEEVAETAALEDNYDIEDGKVVVDVRTLESGNYVAVVTVGEEEAEVSVELDFEAVDELLGNIIAASNAAILAPLLDDEAYFENYDVDNIDAYMTNKNNESANLNTLADVQELVINAANEDAEAGAEFDSLVEAVKDAGSSLAKYNVIKGYFADYVNDNNMDAYLADILDDGEVDAGVQSMEDIQEIIDQVNLDAVVDSDVAITFANIDNNEQKPSELNAYKEALEAVVLADEDTESTTGSNTQTEILDKIEEALDAIDVARGAADDKIAKAETAMAAYKAAKGDDFDEGNEADYEAVEEKIAEFDAEDLTQTELTTKTGELDGLIDTLEDATTNITIIEDALAAIAAFEEAYSGAADINDDVTYAALMKIVYGDDWKTDDPLELEAGLDASKFNTEITDLNTETAEWETYNAVMATEVPAEMRDLLFVFGNDEYVDLTSAQKLEFADRFIEELDAEANYDAIDTLLGTEVTAYTTLITDVNEAEGISDMRDALEAVSDEYDALGAKAKSDIAEDMLTKKPFSTIADIVAAMGL